jgi:hypothetical protein
MWRHFDSRLLAVTTVALAVFAFAFTRPTTVHVTSDLPFDDRGEFSYSGAAPGGRAVYQGDRVSSGQPIFLNLVDRLEFTYSYNASAAAPLIATGDVTLSGTVKDATGWTYPFALAPTTPFEGTEARVSGTVDLRGLRETITAMENATGVKRDLYTVLIGASVNRQVQRGDAVSSGVFAASLEFTFDDLEMHLATPGASALTPSQGGLLSVPVERENHVALLGQAPSVAAVRAVAIGLLLLMAALWIDWLIRSARSDEPTLIQRRYRTYLLPVRSAELTSGFVIDVESISALARIADHTGAPMLHTDSGVYNVIDGDRVYRYSVAAIEVAHAKQP